MRTDLNQRKSYQHRRQQHRWNSWHPGWILTDMEGWAVLADQIIQAEGSSGPILCLQNNNIFHLILGFLPLIVKVYFRYWVNVVSSNFNYMFWLPFSFKCVWTKTFSTNYNFILYWKNYFNKKIEDMSWPFYMCKFSISTEDMQSIGWLFVIVKI